MQSLFTEKVYVEILNRLESLSPDSKPKWGKMDVAQMLAHCCEPLKLPLEKITLAKPNPFMKLLFLLSKDSLINDKPWKKNQPTFKGFKITDERDFQKEKDNLKFLLEEFYSERNKNEWPAHPFLGYLTAEEWGKLQYKHLDYHFRQFESSP